MALWRWLPPKFWGRRSINRKGELMYKKNEKTDVAEKLAEIFAEILTGPVKK